MRTEAEMYIGLSGIRFHRLQKAFIMDIVMLQAKEKATESRDEEAVPTLI